METQTQGIVERRRVSDRRVRPTTLSSALRSYGQRRGFRRAGAGRHTYVDCLSPRVVILVLVVFGSSLFDALLTLRHLEQGGSEANPLMALTLASSPTLFMSVKSAASGIGLGFLAAHQQFPLAMRGLYGLALVYGVIVSAHLLLVLGII